MNAPASGGGRTGGPRALGAVLLLVVLIALLAAMNAGLLGSALAPSAIRRTIDRTGAFAPVLYLLLFAFGTNLMLPASLLAIGGGLAFGWGRALGLTLVGSLGGFVIGYAVSAAVLRRPVRTLLDRLGWLGTLERLERLPPTRLSFASRFIPIPVGAQNLLLGLARLPLLPYLLGSFAGSLPWMLVFTGMGGTASGSFRFPFWAGAGVGLVMMLLADRWWSRRGHRDIPESVLRKAMTRPRESTARLISGDERLDRLSHICAERLLASEAPAGFRDRLFVSAALDRTGFHAMVREGLYPLRRRQRLNGAFRAPEPAPEDTACALWMLVDHARLTNDLSYLKAVYGTVRRGVRHLTRRRLPDSRRPHSGLMPPAVVPTDEPEAAGRYAHTLWCLAGVQEAARAAAALGRSTDVHDAESLHHELRRALARSLAEDGDGPLSSDPGRPVDAAAADALLALVPGDVFAPDWPPLTGTLDLALQGNLGPIPDGRAVDPARRDLILAHHLLRRGDGRVWEQVGSEETMASSAGPLVDALRLWLTRNLLVSDSHDLLLIAPGTGLRRPPAGTETVVEHAPTRFGRLSYRLRSHSDQLELWWGALERTPPTHFIWPLPGTVQAIEPPLATLTATRRALRLDPGGGHLSVRLGPS